MENWPFLREGQLNKDRGWKQKQTNCSSEYSWEVEWLRAIQITRNRREGIVPLIPVRLSFILEQYCATCSVLDYIAECFEAESLKEVSLAAAAHFDRQTLIRVEKFSGLKKTLNNFNVQTKLWVVPVEQFQIMWKKRACELKIIRENRARVTSKFSHIAHTAGNSLSHTHTHTHGHAHTHKSSKSSPEEGALSKHGPWKCYGHIAKGWTHIHTCTHKCRHAVYHAKMLSNQSKKLGSTSQIVAHYHGNTV